VDPFSGAAPPRAAGSGPTAPWCARRLRPGGRSRLDPASLATRGASAGGTEADLAPAPHRRAKPPQGSERPVVLLLSAPRGEAREIAPSLTRMLRLLNPVALRAGRIKMR